ncbi:MAG TPA: ATP-binding protein [Ignavibacteriaceae bacterium]|nr:ATP-binding protein [Ignavibacteriaceae bacterium]
MKRYLYNQILEDLKKKIVFITGPRQVGKTFLAKQIMKNFVKPQYLNYDNINDIRIIKDTSWALNTDLLVFDEIHKMKKWKSYIKGVYDSKPEKQSILITGSARLDTFRQSGDSLAGRYLHLRFNPISVKEISEIIPEHYNALEMLNKFGGFPEPLLNAVNLENEKAETESARWKNQYFSDIIREDILEFSRISEIKTMKTLLQLLRTKVGTPLSFNSIANDLQVSSNTIKKYIQILESLYIVFLITPFHKNIARSILKEPKIYFYDTSFIEGNEGLKLENTCALSLLKNVQFLYDTKGENLKLHYLRTKDNREVDFAVSRNSELVQLIEVKLTENKISPSLKYFAERFKSVEAIQLVHNLKQNEYRDGVNILKAADWLGELSA